MKVTKCHFATLAFFFVLCASVFADEPASRRLPEGTRVVPLLDANGNQKACLYFNDGKCYDSVEALHAGVERVNPERPRFDIGTGTPEEIFRNHLRQSEYRNSVERLKSRREFLAADDLLKDEVRARIKHWGKFETLLDQSIAFTGLGTGNQMYVARPEAIEILRKEVPSWYALEMLDSYRKTAESDSTSKYRYLKVLSVFGHAFVGLSKTKDGVPTVTEMYNPFKPKPEPNPRDVWPYRQRDTQWAITRDYQRNPIYGDLIGYGESNSYSSYWNAVNNFRWIHQDDEAAISEHRSSR